MSNLLQPSRGPAADRTNSWFVQRATQVLQGIKLAGAVGFSQGGGVAALLDQVNMQAGCAQTGLSSGEMSSPLACVLIVLYSIGRWVLSGLKPVSMIRRDPTTNMSQKLETETAVMEDCPWLILCSPVISPGLRTSSAKCLLTYDPTEETPGSNQHWAGSTLKTEDGVDCNMNRLALVARQPANLNKTQTYLTKTLVGCWYT